MTFLKTMVAVGALALSAASANASTVTVKVDETDYFLTTASGTYNNNKSDIEGTEWFGNSSLAQSIANEAAGKFTGPAPFVAYEFVVGSPTEINGYSASAGGVSKSSYSPYSFTYYVIEAERNTGGIGGSFDTNVPPVPLPAAAPMLIAGLGALGFVARRRKKAA